MNAVHFSSASAEWGTPQWLFDALDARFGFTLDPCPMFGRPLKGAWDKTPFGPEFDGLAMSWEGHRVFLNPPYGRVIAQWAEKARREAAERRALVVGLLPARTDAKWWQENVQGHADVRCLAGRLKFHGAKSSAPFPSAIAVWWGFPPLAGGFAHA